MRHHFEKLFIAVGLLGALRSCSGLSTSMKILPPRLLIPVGKHCPFQSVAREELDLRYEQCQLLYEKLDMMSQTPEFFQQGSSSRDNDEEVETEDNGMGDLRNWWSRRVPELFAQKTKLTIEVDELHIALAHFCQTCADFQVREWLYEHPEETTSIFNAAETAKATLPWFQYLLELDRWFNTATEPTAFPNVPWRAGLRSKRALWKHSRRKRLRKSSMSSQPPPPDVKLHLFGESILKDSAVVREEYDQLCEDHGNLIEQKGAQYAARSSLEQLEFLDELKEIEERWEVFYSRLNLMGAFNPEFLNWCDSFLEFHGMTEDAYREQHKRVHQRMREEAKEEQPYNLQEMACAGVLLPTTLDRSKHARNMRRKMRSLRFRLSLSKPRGLVQWIGRALRLKKLWLTS